MAKILIAGGTGLIGKEITQQLLLDKYEVIHLSRSPRADAKVPTYSWNIDKKYIDPEALVDIDYIINLAGAGIADRRWTQARKQAIIDSRVQGNLLFKKYIEEGHLSPKKFISSAAVGIYGDRGNEKLDEQSAVGDTGFLVDCCLQWEESLQGIIALNVPVATVRIGIVLSTEGGALQKMLLPAKLGLGSYFGSGAQIYSWIHIEDISRIFTWLVKQEDAVGIYNGTAPNPISNKKMTEILMKVKPGPGITAPVPSFVLNLMLGEMKDAVLWSSNVFPTRLSEAGFDFKFEGVEEALKNLVA